VRIKFINLQSASESSGSFAETMIKGRLWLPSINLVYYALKSFYKKVGKYYNNYQWLPPEYGWTLSNNLLYESIIEENPDIVCFSLYVWNHVTSVTLAKRIKKSNPNIKIIAGGPDINNIIDKSGNLLSNADLIKECLYFDYIVYGDGEEAFQMLLDHFYEPVDQKMIPNLITKQGVTPHKIFKFKNYESYSPYLDLKEDFIQDYNKAIQIRSRFDIPVDRTYIEENFIRVNYERIRGCPYACSFCDWSSGLHHKVNISQNLWKDEVLFLSKFKYISLRLTDANVGIVESDLDFFKFANSLNTDNFSVSGGNMAKLSKDRVFEIEKINKSPSHRWAVQHLDSQVLKNIDRPDVGWDKHKIFLRKIVNDLNKEVIVELINGLPGSTIDNYIDQHRKFIEIPITTIRLYWWDALPNSPAFDKNYQEIHNLKIVNSVFLFRVYREKKELPVHQELVDLYLDLEMNNYSIEESYNTRVLYQYGEEKTLTNGQRIITRKFIKSYFLSIYVSVIYNMCSASGLINISDVNSRVRKFDECINYALPLIIKLSEKLESDFEQKVERFGFYIWAYIDKDQIVPISDYIIHQCHKLFLNKFKRIVES